MVSIRVRASSEWRVVCHNNCWALVSREQFVKQYRLFARMLRHGIIWGPATAFRSDCSVLAWTRLWMTSQSSSARGGFDLTRVTR